MTALEAIFHQPIDLYAAGVDTLDEPSILSDGSLHCGATGTKIHFFPGTTGMSEVGALRDCLSAALSTLGTFDNEPSVSSLVSDAMSTVKLPLRSDGDNYLFEQLSSLEVEYTVLSDFTSASVSFPTVSFYTEGDVSGDGSYNWQDIKGAQIGKRERECVCLYVMF
jgi:hypothetical protein